MAVLFLKRRILSIAAVLIYLLNALAFFYFFKFQIGSQLRLLIFVAILTAMYFFVIFIFKSRQYELVNSNLDEIFLPSQSFRWQLYQKQSFWAGIFVIPFNILLNILFVKFGYERVGVWSVFAIWMVATLITFDNLYLSIHKEAGRNE